MKKLSQSGFGILELLLILVVVVALGGGGYYIWHKNHDEKSSNSHHATSTATQTSNSGTAASNEVSSSISTASETCGTTGLNVSAWSVSLPSEPSGLGKVCYSVASNGNDLMLSSDLQKSMPVSCNLSQPTGPWGITRYSASTVDATQKDALTHIGDYYYQFVYPQQGCSQASTLNSDYQTMFQSLEVD